MSEKIVTTKILGKSLPLVFLLASCTSLTPEFSTPEVALADRWLDVALLKDDATAPAANDIGWRDFFLDKDLQLLIAQALQYNHDLRQAALNVELTQAQYRIQYAGEMPLVGASLDGKRSATPRDLSPLRRAMVSDQYSVGLGVAAFELDFFGKIRSKSEAVLNRYFATKEAKDSAQLSIISAVAKTYYQARIAAAAMQLAQKVLTSRQESYRLAKLQFQSGVISAIALHGVEAQIEMARAEFAVQKRNEQQARHALAVLIGKPLANLKMQTSLDLQFAVANFAAAIPSEILYQRPDVREAEFQLRAANADIGAARAAFYPSITLTGNLGLASTELDNLFAGDNRMWSFAPQINLPIFDGGRRKAGLAIAETMQAMAIEKYQSTVQAAFRDVADALIARQTLLEQYNAQKRGNAAVAERMRLENLRFQNGVSSALDILDAQRESYSSSQQLLFTELNLLHNRVDLYTAMGGGLRENSAAAKVSKVKISAPPDVHKK